MEIKFEEYLIRSWRVKDLKSLQRYANNRKIWANLRDVFPHPYTLEDAQFWIDICQAEEPQRSFAIASKTEVMGGIGLIFGEDVHTHTAELGYWLGEPFWGKAIMSRAVVRLVSYAFEAYPISRIYALPFASNTASRKVLEKAGFSLEGILRRNVIKAGQFHDQALYALVRD
jgi:RimJ/RimL family protein N-acetyltransferase